MDGRVALLLETLGLSGVDSFAAASRVVEAEAMLERIRQVRSRFAQEVSTALVGPGGSDVDLSRLERCRRYEARAMRQRKRGIRELEGLCLVAEFQTATKGEKLQNEPIMTAGARSNS
jgi:hypothetical protein